MHNVKDFGAIGDGVTLDTAAVQAAINAGGMVYFPRGTYLCGTLYLKSNGGLELAPNATILASPDEKDYNADDFCPQNFTGYREGASGAHLIVAVEQENVTICGRGTIDGNAPVFHHLDEQGNNVPWRGTAYRPAQMIFFCECDRVTVENVRLYRAPYWTSFYYGCTEVMVHGVRIDSLSGQSSNSDGIDIDCCSRVTITSCIIRTGDDCITLRGDGVRLKQQRDCEYVTVSDCILTTETNAIRIGVGTGVVHNAIFSNLVICQSIHGVTINNRFRAQNLDGSWNGFCKVRNITFTDMDIEAYYPITLATDWYGVFQDPACEPIIENIAFRNMRIRARRSCNVCGQSDRTVRSLIFSDILMTLHGPGNVSGVDGGVKDWAWGTPNAAFRLQGVKNAEFYRVRVESADPDWKYGIFAENCENIRSVNSDMLLPDELH